MNNRLAIAVWRFEQLSPLLDDGLSPGERGRLVRVICRTPVLWPNGDERPLPRATLLRWWKAYREDPRIESLMPKAPAARRPSSVKPEAVAAALAWLEEEPARSLYVLSKRLNREHRPKVPVSRSALHRALQNEPRYRALRRRLRGETRPRRRFQAKEPHQIWQGDAKGPFPAWLASGERIELTVLSILDDSTRHVAAAQVCEKENVEAAVKTFRRAAARWGLPDAFYADRHSAYDADLFRQGLALSGVRRIPTKARNAPARGKIEAYHRVLERWFVKELRHQRILDVAHAQALLEAVIEELYHPHRHRGLRMPPREALQGRVSRRGVSLERLHWAFLEDKRYRPHPKTGEVDVKGTLYRVPKAIWAPRVTLKIDPEGEGVYLEKKDGTLVPLPPAVDIVEPETKPPREKEPLGSLTSLLEEYRGRRLPLARAGFGLPEVYARLGEAVGRAVPATEGEANRVAGWLARHGPFDPDAFDQALQRTVKTLGEGRPLVQILDALTRRIRPEEKP